MAQNVGHGQKKIFSLKYVKIRWFSKFQVLYNFFKDFMPIACNFFITFSQHLWKFTFTIINSFVNNKK